MISKLFFAIIFTNLIGVVYDMLRSNQSYTYRKAYVTSVFGVILMLFIRNITFPLSFIFFDRRRMYIPLSIVFFIAVIYFLIDYQVADFKTEIYHLFAFSFIFWAFTYAYIAIISDFFYLKDDAFFSERELRIAAGIASKEDKFFVFINNIFSSLYAPLIYILAIITAIYTYFIGWLVLQ